ncbi:MAG: hypothetical protein EA370_04110 [Wenzhouxiangella sp.]|nr:MAG: hypothetical protein EA370_04110 [Wenzhouxiangella sp.]
MSSNRARNARLSSLFQQALEQPADSREAWLRQHCEDDTALYRAVAALLAADADSADPFADALEAAARDLGDSASPLVGRKIGPWEIIREIGRGGMGAVLLARRADDEYQREVAIKLIRGFPDSASLERLRFERQVLADLNHPRIAAMIDGGTTDDGQPYLVMEFIDGESIDEWCRQRQLPLPERIKLLIDVCEAVHFAHQQLIVHRDLKPANVLVGPDGKPKLLDFGIAKLLPVSQSDLATAPVTQHRFYTPHFSSPEHIAGKPVSTASDVYSLGRLLEAVLTREGEDDQRLPGELKAVIRHASAERPEDRYASAAALADDLKRYLSGVPVLAAGHRPGYFLRKFLWRHRLATGATLLALLLLAGLVTRIVIENERTQRAEIEARLAAANAEQVTDFLIELIGAARPEQARGEDVTVMAVLDQGRERIERAAFDDPTLRARLALALGRSFEALELYEPAADIYSQAASDAERAYDPELLIRALTSQGLTLTFQASLDMAESALARAEQLLERQADPAGELVGNLKNAWGIWANESGQGEFARSMLQEALEIRRGLDALSSATASTLHNLALLERSLDQPAVALDHINESLDIKQRTLGEDHPALANSLRLRSILERSLGRHRQSRATLAELLDLRLKLFGESDPILVDDYNELANAHHDLGEYQQAIALYARILELHEPDGEPGAISFVYRNNLGAAYEDHGDLARAETLYRQSLALRLDQFGPEHPNTLRTQHNLARVLTKKNRLAEAQALAEATLASRQQALGDDHGDTRLTRILIDRIVLAMDPNNAEPLERLIEHSDQLLEDLAPHSLRALLAHASLGEAKLRSGQLEPARLRLQTAIDGLREALDPDHPLAAELEVDLAWIDLLEGNPASAQARLSQHHTLLHDTLHHSAPRLRQKDCLETGQSQASCWEPSHQAE